MPGKLILLPNLLEESLSPERFLPAALAQVVQSMDGLIAESEKAGRRYLRKFLSHEEMATKPLLLLNEHTKELGTLLEPLKRGECWGLISDAGLPCIADPGSDLVWLARGAGVAIETYAGPSSILFALQLSGLPSQRFAFHGYLPREVPLLEKTIRELEKQSTTQIFIEAPYRSTKLLEILLKTLSPKTKLCVAANLTTPDELVISQVVAKWTPVDLGKSPAVFLFFP